MQSIKSFIHAVTALVLYLTSHAAMALVCADDLDGSGAIDNPIEYAQCQSTSQGDYCPVGSAACTIAETCPLDSNISCVSGQCTKPGICQPIGDPLNNTLSFQCSINGNVYSDRSACTAACTQTAQCTSAPPQCPLGNQYACMETTAGNFRCSPNECVDEAAIGEVNTDVDTSMPDNSGPRDASGACIGQIRFFAGRRMTCKKAGVKSNFTNCCNQADRDTVSDSMGTDIEGLVIQEGISLMATFAANAYQAYATGLSAQTSATYAWNQVTNPGVLNFSVTAIVIQYLLTPQCNQMDMETSSLKRSGFCHYVGTYCSSSWPLVGCVQKKNTYCCFNSELARIINEQGRQQMAIAGGWGTAESPNCQGFTPEEFQSLDFGAMDLSEYYGNIQDHANTSLNANQPQQQTQDAVQDFYNNLQ